MDGQEQNLLSRILAPYRKCPQDKRVLIGISGIPGSGKTTIATRLVTLINEAAEDSIDYPYGCHLMSLDGFHLTRAELDNLPDPIVAHARRGAAFTFDAPGFLRLIQQLRQPVDSRTELILAPSFYHATKDPVLDTIKIPPECRIVLVEGNYLSLGTGAPEWKQAAEMMDELWFVDVPEDVARERLIRRHVAAGIAHTEEEAAKRVDENDLLNGREIVNGRLPVHVTILG